jgi:hypothetical protein
MIVLDPGGGRQTFTLTDTITLTTDDTSVAANMNTGSGSTQMSEFGGYTKADPIQFSSTSGSRTSKVETNGTQVTSSNGGCFITVAMSGKIYAKRVGNDLVWYIGQGDTLTAQFGDHYKEGSQYTGAASGGTDPEVARLAGVGSNTSTTVSVTYSTLETSGQVDVTAGAYSTGSTSNNLTSTNTNCGFDFRLSGQGECLPNGTDVVYRFQVDYTVTHPSHVARKFRFFVALKGRYTTTRANCC